MSYIINPTANDAAVAAAQLVTDAGVLTTNKEKVLLGEVLLAGADAGTLGTVVFGGTPTGTSLDLTNMGLVTWTVALPSSLTSLVLPNNQLTTWTVALPSSLASLQISGNQLTTWTVALPSSLKNFDPGENQLTSAGVNAALAACVAANLVGCDIFLDNQIPSAPPTGNMVVSGTLSPNVAGTFVATTAVNGRPCWLLAGTPNWYLASNAGLTAWFISDTAGAVGTSGNWVLTSTYPWGDYTPDGVIATGTATVTGVTATGWKNAQTLLVANTPTFDWA